MIPYNFSYVNAYYFALNESIEKEAEAHEPDAA
jgi:hypothetical protein